MIRSGIKSLMVFSALLMVGCSTMSERTEAIFTAFLREKESEIRLLTIETNQAFWDIFANNLSFDSAVIKYKNLEKDVLKNMEAASGAGLMMNSFYSNVDDFDFLQNLDKSGRIQDSLLRRQLDLILRKYALVNTGYFAESQELVGKYFKIQEEIDSISRKTNVRSAITVLQHPEKFISLREDYVNLVKRMNQKVKQLGFSDYFLFQLYMEEINPIWFSEFLDKMEKETRPDYQSFKEYADGLLTVQFGKDADYIGYNEYAAVARKIYFEPQMNASVQKDTLMGIIEKDLEKQGFFLDDVFRNSDLWYREGKKDFSFVLNIDNGDDIRIFGNYRETPVTLTQILHEIGHAVHYKYIDDKLPFFLKEPTETLSEGIAMYFKSRLEHSRELKKDLGVTDLKEGENPLENIINPLDLFSIRALIAGSEFERLFFADPEQDPDVLWAQMAEKYLLIPLQTKSILPFYYYSYHHLVLGAFPEKYLVGFAIAAQLNHLSQNGEDFGKVLKEKVLSPGSALHWEDIILNATGEPLNPGYIKGLIRRNQE